MRQTKNEVGNRYGRLTVLERAGSVLGGGATWLCRCDCGNAAVKAGKDLRQGFGRSCGCSIGGATHKCSKGGNRTRAYTAWKNMKNRCYNKSNKSYQDYGGRGINVCEEWLNFETFLTDMKEPEPGMTLDRIDNNGDYSKANCRWATRAIQNRNRRNNVMITIDGETKTMIEWSRVSGIGYLTIRERLRRGWEPKDAVFKVPSGSFANGIRKDN